MLRRTNAVRCVARVCLDADCCEPGAADGTAGEKMDVNIPNNALPDPAEVAAAVANVSAQAHEMIANYVEQPGAADMRQLDPLGVMPAFGALAEALMRDPARVLEAQANAWNAWFRIWQQSTERLLGVDSEPVVSPAAGDRRFRADDWEGNPFFDYVRQTYLATSGVLQQLVADVEGLDDHTRQKLTFYTRQYVDAIAPTNFALTNPEVLHATVSTGGRNLLDGLRNFLGDIDPASGRLRTRMVDKSAFELGRNVAVTPGKVVFENELMQLIQYTPTTDEVATRPLLIIPPWINKFYILDLQEKNSFIRWLVDQGQTVFVISWINPDESLADKDFDDYLREGPLAALDAMTAATGAESFNVIGYCLGGTLLGATLALMKARGDTRFNAATFFTAMLDFSEPGDLGVFIDEEQLQAIEAMMAERGYLDGAEMATTFNMLRANDLIWSFVVNNYLLGREPMAFDLLYWNSDSTRMPARMHSTYLRRMYLENEFMHPGGMSVDGTPLDLTQIDLPVCFVSAVEDHIAPWKSTFMGAQIFRGPTRFLLSQAGHIAGIINPPGPRQYGHYTGPDPRGMSADEWLTAASHSESSWWPVWREWLDEHAGGRVPARQPGDGGLAIIEDAPGRYVRA